MDKKNKKDPIVIYWGPSILEENLYYPNPKNLFLNLTKEKNTDRGEKSFFVCPSFQDKTKNIFSFSFPSNASYEWDFSDGKEIFRPTNNQNPFINFQIARHPSINNSPQIQFNLVYSFFCEEPLNATFTAPYFSEPNYTKHASVAPGTMDIGQWFRPYPIEMTFWKEKGRIDFKDGESLFYVEFLTDRPIILKRYRTTQRLVIYSQTCVSSPSNLSARVPLFERYKRFNESEMNKLVLKEIKENLL
jgi:hypothetical protein